MKEILKHLMEMEGFSYFEAIDWIKDARKQIAEGVDPEELLCEIGLEPDYAIDLCR